ncbi:MAG: HlyD family secretion protein [Aeromonadaceae bacterium]
MVNWKPIKTQDRGIGEPLRFLSPSESVVVYLAAIVIILLIAFFYFGTYTKKVDLRGRVVPSAGQISIYSDRKGYVSNVFVNDMQPVKKGQPLFEITAELFSQNRSLTEQVVKELNQQKDNLQHQVTTLQQLHGMQLQEMKARLVDLIKLRAEQQRMLTARAAAVEKYKKILERLQTLNHSKYESQYSLDMKELELFSSEADYAEAAVSKVNLDNSISQLEKQLASRQIEQQKEILALKKEISSIQLDIYNSEAAYKSVIVAPKDGMVTSMTIKQGTAVNSSSLGMVILPRDAQWVAEVFSTSKEIGSIKENDSVLLRFDAFPYQKFGTYSGKVIRVARAAIKNTDIDFPLSNSDDYYKIQISLDKQHIRAYGKNEPLQSGMALTASIKVDNRSLINWLLDPIYSITGGSQS